MCPVAVVTDTTAYLPAEVLAANDIHVVSLYVHRDGASEREADVSDLRAYYQWLRTTPVMPTTSQPSIGDFLAVYEPLIEAGHDILSIHLSSGISGTFGSASQAADRVAEDDPGKTIRVIDSATTCGGLGLPVLAAAAAARTGETLEECETRASEALAQTKIWFCLDTLEFLRRSGRVGGARAWMGSTLKIKPILTVGDGVIQPVERVRTERRASERMIEYLESRREDGADGWIVQHIDAEEKAHTVADRGRELFGCEPAFISEVGPVIGTHIGPGMIGVGGVPRSFLD